MKRSNFLLIFLSFGACSDANLSSRTQLNSCWKNVSKYSSHFKIDFVEYIYLRGETIIIPSVNCVKIRMQAREFSKGALKQLREIEYRDSSIPLRLRGSIIFDVVDQKTSKVIEIKVISLPVYTKLDRIKSNTIVNVNRISHDDKHQQ